MNSNLSQVLGLVALINTHKALKARHPEQSKYLPYRLIPVGRSLNFKECFTILASTFLVATAAGVVVITAVGVREMKEIYKLEMRRMDR